MLQKKSSGLVKAIQFASDHHYYQMRLNGDPYIEHPLNTLKILLPFKLSEKLRMVAVLHDVCEESNLHAYDLKKIFGKDISMMVYFLTKAEKHFFCHHSKKRLDHYIEKIKQGALLYPEILLVKMADQLDNLKTLQVFSDWKQQEILNEIKSSYIPMYELFKNSFQPNQRQAFKGLLSQLKEAIIG